MIFRNQLCVIVAHIINHYTVTVARLLGLAVALFTANGCLINKDKQPEVNAFDAGTIFSSETPTLSHVFNVRNLSNRTVKILGENHSCSCTKVNLERAILKPGSSVQLTMTVKVPIAYSIQEISCVVKTDHPQYAEWPYRLKFTSYPEASIEPRIIEFGTINQDTSVHN